MPKLVTTGLLTVLLAILTPLSAQARTANTNRPSVVARTPVLGSGAVHENGRIAYDAYVGNNPAILVANADGSDVHQVTHPTGAADTHPAWSPNGSTIAFGREYQTGPRAAQIFTVRADGTGLRQMTHCPQLGCYEPSYSPNGRWLAFERGNASGDGIVVMRSDGSGPIRNVTFNPPTNQKFQDQSAQWSPDGSQLVFVRQRLSDNIVAVFTVHLDGSHLHQLTPWSLDAADPDWAPNRNLIVFSSAWDPMPFPSDIYTIKPDGTDLDQITHNADTNHQSLGPVFSPDGRTIMFAHWPGAAGNADLYTIDSNGGDMQNITQTPNRWEENVDWGPRPT